MKTKRHHRYVLPLQFACFECREVFKHESRRHEEKSRPRCPQCGVAMTWMGRAFRAPRNSDARQWKKVELLAQNGFTFWSYVGRMPDTLTEARAFIESRKKLSDGEKLANQLRKRPRPRSGS